MFYKRDANSCINREIFKLSKTRVLTKKLLVQQKLSLCKLLLSSTKQANLLILLKYILIIYLFFCILYKFL